MERVNGAAGRRAALGDEIIVVDGAGRTFGRGNAAVEALAATTLEVFEGEFFSLVGPSGCGKSTLLNLIAGFDRPDRGRVLVQGRPVTGPDPRRLLVFQDYGLFPWRSALGNVELGLEIAGVPLPERRIRARALLERMGLGDFEDKRPHELSGGMRQRVNIARSLAADPDILLMDEPFGAVDALTRMELQDDLLRLHRSGGKTVVLVTHDIEEAIYLGDRVAVMSERPGAIRATVPVGLAWPRDRTSAEFTHLREVILELFRLIPERRTPEYSI
ncbi:MAG: ABC transporter ATP-binding protein [Thermoleophilia bacterium]